MDRIEEMSQSPPLLQAGVVDQLIELDQETRESLLGAQAHLQNRFRLLGSQDPSKGGGWSQFLDEHAKALSVTGTAHGVISLIACGEPRDSELITLATRFIRGTARRDGSWTKPDLHAHCGLTRITGLAIRALLDAGEPFLSPPITSGIDWLIGAQNADGGWGNLANDGASDVTSTGFALQALARIPGLSGAGREAVQRGRHWLLAIRNPDYSWGYTAGKRGTIAQTSEAIDGLLASGQDRSAVAATHDWLTKHIHEDAQFIERYVISLPPLEGTSIIWTQVSRERGLIVLLRLGSSVASPEVVNSVRRILGRQVERTYWRAEAHADSEPVWALKEAVISLRLFRDHLERDRAAIALSEELSLLRNEVVQLRTELACVGESLAAKTLRARAGSWLRYLRRPASLLILLTMLLIGLYILLRSRLALPQYADLLAGVLGIVGVVLTLYSVVRDRARSQERS